MGKVRVYELAKELGMANKELVLKLQELGYPVKSHSSTIEDFLLQEIKNRISGRKSQVAEEAKARPTVIRRRKKVQPVEPEEEKASGEDEREKIADDQDEPAGAAIEDETRENVVRVEDVVKVATVADLEARDEPEEEDEGQLEADEPEAETEVAPEAGKEAELEADEAEVQATEIEPSEEKPTLEAQDQAEEREAAEAEAEPEQKPVQEIQEEQPPVGTEAEAVRSGKDEQEAVESLSVEDAESEVEVLKSQAAIEEKVEHPEEVEVKAEPEKTPQTSEKTASKKTAPTEKKPDKKKEPKVKRIEKTTTEPAKIISLPTTPELPFEPAAGPVEARSGGYNKKPPPPVDKFPDQRKVTEVFPGGGPSPDNKRSKKRKKGSKDGGALALEESRKRGVKRREIIEKTDLYDKNGWDRSGRGRKTSRGGKKPRKTEVTVPKAIKRRIKVVEAITVADLAKKMGIKSGDIIRKLMSMGMMAHLNQSLDFDSAALVAAEFGYEVEQGAFDEEVMLHVAEQKDMEREFRPPVVTVMGHVDHGKTSLLDAIRQTSVTDDEAGGITQHIGAYHVEIEGGRITFLDTPGHEAFTAMRARGAQVTDIVVLIVAADDGVMLQTREAADHARAAGVPILVAVNKIDKPEADPERVRRELSEIGLAPEAWGGDTIFVDVSAKTGQGVKELQDMILLQSEILELKAVSEGRATGRIIEARLDKGRGPVATVLVQSGRLKQNDYYVCGVFSGKVRAMFNDVGQRVDEAGPSIPVEIQGISGVPNAGDEFVVVEDEKKAKQVSQHRQLRQRETELIKTSKVTLENLFDSIKDDGVKELNLVLKADVQGSLEAIVDALSKMATDEIKIHIISSSIGAITETDIMLASASDALVVGFNVRPNAKVQDLAEQENIQIRFYDVIYKLIEEIKEAMAGLLDPIQQEKTLGRAEVRSPFHVSKVGTIAGSAVTDGKIVRGARARLLRNDVVVYDGRIDSLKRFKDDAKEVLSGYECGIGLENYNDIKAGDVIEAYLIEEVAATLE